MDSRDRRHDPAFERLDDHQLEALRKEMLASGDVRLELVIRALVLRSVPVIEKVCRQRGAARGISRGQVLKSIEDASVRVLLRLKRPDRQPLVTALAAEVAAACIDAQSPGESQASRLAPKQPELRVAEQLGEALQDGRARRNNWRNS